MKLVVLASGSYPRSLPGLDVDGDRVITSEHALRLDTVPASVVVLGGGVIGCEFASVWRSFGAEVTIVEALPRLVPAEDEASSKALERAFRKRGIAFKTGTPFQSVKTTDTGVAVTVEGGDVLEAELLLVAVGRGPVTDGLGLDEAGVKTERGWVVVDDQLRTNLPGVYAIGDITAKKLLAHLASHQGIVAAENAAGHDKVMDYKVVPGCTYTHPEVASVGLTEKQAREAGHDVLIGKYPFLASGRARTAGESDGMVKVVADRKYGELLGVHIIGPRAGDLIAEAVAAMEFGASAEDLARTCHAHPTLAEAVKEAALDAGGRVIHI